MKNACNRYAQVKNSKGEMVDSRLFKDLLHYTSNDRDKAKSLYKLAKSSEFLNSAGDRIVKDDLGEATLESLLKVTGDIANSDGNLIDAFNKSINTNGNSNGIYSFHEAIERLQGFNRIHRSNDGYMATIEKTGSNYHLHVVKRTTANENKLNETIANENTQNRIIATLARHGISTEFLENAEEGSRFSTENAERTADGLLALVKVAKGEKVNEDLAEEAGHVAIASLSDTPLVQRLFRSLSKEVQRDLLGEEYDTKYLGQDARREVAGDLVGKALNDGIDKQTYVGRLIRRVKDFILKTFYKIKDDNIKIARIEALRIADEIARGFMSPTAAINEENILAKKETLYSKEYNPKVTAYKTLINQIKHLSGELKAANAGKMAEIFEGIASQVEVGRTKAINENPDLLANLTAISGIAEAIDLITTTITTDLPEILNSVDFDDHRDFAFNMVRNGGSLRQAHIVYRSCLEMLQGINLVRKYLGADEDLQRIQYIDPISGGVKTSNLIHLLDKLSDFVGEGTQSFYTTLKQKEYEFFLKFLENSYGRDYIDRSGRVLFKWKNWNERHKHLVEFVPGKRYTIRELLSTLENDISLFDRHLASMANSSDIIGQIVDKVIKQSNKNADDITNQVWDRLRVLKSEMKARCGTNDSSIFYEKYNGKLTGAFISSVYWGLWEQRYKDMMKTSREAFKEAHRLDSGGYDYDNLSDFEKSLLWDSFLKERVKAWHKENSVWDEEEGRYMPSNTSDNGKTNYTNPEFSKLTLGQRQFLGELMDIKAQMDGFIDNSMPLLRAPQFKGRFINRVRNRGSVLSPKAYGRGIFNAVTETFCMDSEDSEYGCENTYNAQEEDVLDDDLGFQQEKYNRLTLFGVNRLKNMDDLSTDVFHSLLAYTSMATHYNAMNAVVDVMEVGKNVLNERSYKDRRERNREANKTRAYNRYLKFLDKQVYGISQKNPIILWKKIVLNKLASFFSGLASKIYLGGNVTGGIVNLGTGIIEIAKESFSGEFFTLKDWKDANLIYWKSLPKNLWQTGQGVHDDKVNLFCRHFNILGLNKHAQKEWYTRRTRAAKFFYGECLLMPYSAGDHYMQSMSYLAMAKGKKLIDSNGNTVSMWDAYKVKKLDNHAGHTLELQGDYFETEEDKEEYSLINRIIDRILNNEELDDNDKNYIASLGFENESGQDLVDLLSQLAYSKKWNEDKESAFMDRAREINDRLHGIYNDQDKTAFHQGIATNMLLAMRGYALGMAQRRFGTQKYSVALGGEVEGTLRTLAKVIAATSTDSWGWGKAVRAMFLPDKKTQDNMMKAGFSMNQYRNMRRNFADYLFILGIYLLYLVTIKSDDDDDDEEDLEAYYADLRENYGYTEEDIKQLKEEDKQTKKDAAGNGNLMGLIHYLSMRLLREQAAYNTFVGAEDEYKNVTSLTPAGLSIIYDLNSFFTNLGGAMIYDYQKYDPEYFDSLKEYGYTKEEIAELKKEEKERIKNAPGQKYFYKKSGDGYEQGDPKYLRKLLKMLPYYRSMMILEHPYEAVESYKFGRTTK